MYSDSVHKRMITQLPHLTMIYKANHFKTHGGAKIPLTSKNREKAMGRRL